MLSYYFSSPILLCPPGKKRNPAVENQGFVVVVATAIGVTLLSIFLIFQYIKSLRRAAEGIDVTPLPHGRKAPVLNLTILPTSLSTVLACS